MRSDNNRITEDTAEHRETRKVTQTKRIYTEYCFGI